MTNTEIIKKILEECYIEFPSTNNDEKLVLTVLSFLESIGIEIIKDSNNKYIYNRIYNRCKAIYVQDNTIYGHDDKDYAKKKNKKQRILLASSIPYFKVFVDTDRQDLLHIKEIIKESKKRYDDR